MMSMQLVLALPSVPFGQRRRLLPDKPGLYFVVRAGEEIMYVGMSRKSIQRRWKVWHQVVYDVDNSGIGDQTEIAYLVYSDTERLIDDERAAIREFRPPFNYSHVPGAYVRMQQQQAVACRWIDCNWHDHRRWPQIDPPTGAQPSIFD